MSGAAWDRAWNEAQNALDDARNAIESSHSPAARPVRVGQMDADLLDQELLSLLKQPLSSSISLIKSTWAPRFDLEITFLIQAILYKYSVWDSGATYGAKLQDLRYERPPKQAGARLAPSGLPRRLLVMHATITIVIPYLHARLRAHALSQSWPDTPRTDPRRRLWDTLATLENLQATVALFGLIAFLWDGRYRTVTDRVLKLKLIPARRVVTRNVNYEFMNRQMVWQAFTEFLLFVLPLINTRVLRKRVTQWTTKILRAILTTINPPSLVPSTAGEKSGLGNGKYAALPEESCAICAEDADSAPSKLQANASGNTGATHAADGIPPFPINVAYRTSCGHMYCYHCLTGRIMAAADDGDAGWECLRCREVVLHSSRVEEVFIEDDSSDRLSEDRDRFRPGDSLASSMYAARDQ